MTEFLRWKRFPETKTQRGVKASFRATQTSGRTSSPHFDLPASKVTIDALSDDEKKKIADLVSDLAKADCRASALQNELEAERKTFSEKLAILNAETETRKLQERLVEQKLAHAEAMVAKCEQDISFFKKEIEHLTNSLQQFPTLQHAANLSASSPKKNSQSEASPQRASSLEIQSLQQQIDKLEGLLLAMQESRNAAADQALNLKKDRSSQLQTLLKSLVKKHTDSSYGKTIDLSSVLSDFPTEDADRWLSNTDKKSSDQRDPKLQEYERLRADFLRKKTTKSPPQSYRPLAKPPSTRRARNPSSAYQQYPPTQRTSDRLEPQPKLRDSFLFESDTSMARSLLEIVDDMEREKVIGTTLRTYPLEGTTPEPQLDDKVPELSWEHIKLHTQATPNVA